MLNQTKKAKSLRSNSTDAERLLWKYLRTKQIEGLKFRRQEPIGKYIADFVCYEKGIVVEVDGGQHDGSEKDVERDAWLESQGFRVLRFWNTEVLLNIDGVVTVIRDTCMAHPSQPLPSREGLQRRTEN